MNTTKIMMVKGVAEAKKVAGDLLTFRAPHYSVSALGMLDELRIATGGVLFLDDLDRYTATAQLAALETALAKGGPLPLAILVDVELPADTKNDREGHRLAMRIESIVDKLEDALGE